MTVLVAGDAMRTVPATGNWRETAFEYAGMARAEHVVLATGQQPDQATALVPALCQQVALHMDHLLLAVAALVLPCCSANLSSGYHYVAVQVHLHHRGQLKHLVFQHSGDQQKHVQWTVIAVYPAEPPDLQKQRMALF